MATEIERKFLVKRELFEPQGEGLHVKQGYISSVGDLIVRVRRHNDKAYLTLKGRTSSITRPEYEYEIPTADADELFAYCKEPVIDKTRYYEKLGSHTWEIDIFYGDNEGLMVAEIELESEDEHYEIPLWLGKEVSDDPRYYNVNLVKNPYKNWKHDV